MAVIRAAATWADEPCPDDPIASIHTTALQEARDLAAVAIVTHAGNRQVLHLAQKIRNTTDVCDARILVCRALLKSKTNRPLQDLALDVINRLRGL